MALFLYGTAIKWNEFVKVRPYDEAFVAVKTVDDVRVKGRDTIFQYLNRGHIELKTPLVWTDFKR